MKPKALLTQLDKTRPAAGYLFLGNELFYRDRCRQALIRAALGEASDNSDALIEFDLKEQPFEKLLDEARTFSLFASQRLIIGSNAEAALPRRVTTRGDSPEGAALAAYFKDPTPGVTILLECRRYGWNDREEKDKLERVAKFYAAVPQTVELAPLSAAEALALSQRAAKHYNLDVAPDLLAELVEMLGNDMARLSSDLEKLALYLGGGRAVTRQDLEVLIPEARQSGVFELTDALARKDRPGALQLVDTLAKTGEYWPLQLSMLARLFRQALAAKEQGARAVPQITRLFQSHGTPMWPARARQILEVGQKFSRRELERALIALFRADRDLRRERPTDRIIIEQLVVEMTS
jgi:DNA polymerase III subunit delta